jgi:CDP-glucose 4,6-dehydratase
MENKPGKMENLVEKLHATFRNKKVVITGHTGFKGSWLTQWLLKMGAEVYGMSKEVPKQPSMYADNELAKYVKEDLRINILDEKALLENIERIKPDFIFHLAAQPIVSVSYENPVETFKINTIGYACVLNAVRNMSAKCVLVLASSDKCYKNKEWLWGYRENDEFGGNDPYSASKGAAEIVFQSFYHSFFKNQDEKRVSSVRAGNVIGGGDWSRDRIIPDAMRAWHKNESLVIRRPEAVRPWQFVLEPLFGYLLTAALLSENNKYSGEGFNFGPDTANSITVGELLNEIQQYLGYGTITIDKPENIFYETSMLRINSDKAKTILNWYPVLNIKETTTLIADWYNAYKSSTNLYDFTNEQIQFFEQSISSRLK